MEIVLIIALVIVVALIALLVYAKKDGDRRYAELKGEAECRYAELKGEKETQIEELKSIQQQVMNEKIELQQENTQLIVKLENAQQLLEMTKRQAQKEVVPWSWKLVPPIMYKGQFPWRMYSMLSFHKAPRRPLSGSSPRLSFPYQWQRSCRARVSP